MTLINYKSVSKLNWTKYYLLSTVGADNNDASSNKIILIIIDTTLYVPVVILSAKNNKKQSKLYSKGLKDQFIGMNIKQKVRMKIQQMNVYIFSNQTLLELIDFLF